MKINKKIVIFTFSYPTGNSENTFIKFELSKLKFYKKKLFHKKTLEEMRKLKKKT